MSIHRLTKSNLAKLEGFSRLSVILILRSSKGRPRVWCRRSDYNLANLETNREVRDVTNIIQWLFNIWSAWWFHILNSCYFFFYEISVSRRLSVGDNSDESSWKTKCLACSLLEPVLSSNTFILYILHWTHFSWPWIWFSIFTFETTPWNDPQTRAIIYVYVD